MTTPFYTGTVPYAGGWPDPYATPAPWDTTTARFWVGAPATMIELPSPDPAAYTVEASRGRVEHGLASGVSAVTQFADSTRRWGLSWQRLASRDFDRIKALDAGMYGGELIYVQPEDRNHLTLTQSMCGALRGFLENWSTAFASVPVYDATVTPPIEPSGVIRWTPASTNDRLVPNPNAAVPDYDHCAPDLIGETATFSVWVMSNSGTATVTLRMVARDGNSVLIGTATGTAATISGWTQLSVTVPAGTFPSNAAYLLPSIAATGQILVANPQLEYRAAPTDWTAGGGVARVLAPGTLPRTLDVWRNSALTWTLAESVTGAC